MTQEDKQLLLHDLCARIPYGVMIEHKGKKVKHPMHFLSDSGNTQIYFPSKLIRTSVEHIKPYLRSMSDMTPEEAAEYAVEWDKRSPYGVYPACDWLNAHHFDYRGLIEKGLAVAVTPENNPYK